MEHLIFVCPTTGRQVDSGVETEIGTLLRIRQQKVRVVGRNAAHLQPFAAQGAEIFVGDVTDASALTKALQQADSAYVMIPPNVTSVPSLK